MITQRELLALRAEWSLDVGLSREPFVSCVTESGMRMDANRD